MVEFEYFNEECNNEKIRENNSDKRRVAPCVAHAYASEEQEEILEKEKA